MDSSDLERAVAEVLGKERAGVWLYRPHPMLEGVTPMELAKQGSDGLDRVLELVTAIRYGSAA
jgi:uncharacterized protein (DUF2384 family)